jgi:hypothetical protein
MLETAQPSGGAATRQSAAPAEQYKVDPYSQVSRRSVAFIESNADQDIALGDIFAASEVLCR